MKKSVLLLGAIILASCSTDSANNTDTTDCDCGVVVQTMSYNIPNNNGGVIVQSTITVRNRVSPKEVDALGGRKNVLKLLKAVVRLQLDNKQELIKQYEHHKANYLI